MRKQQPTPVDTGTQSTERAAVKDGVENYKIDRLKLLITRVRQANLAYANDQNSWGKYVAWLLARSRVLKYREIPRHNELVDAMNAARGPNGEPKVSVASQALDDYYFEIMGEPGRPVSRGYLDAICSTSKPNMANEKQTPADTGKKSTEAGAVQVAGKPTKHKCQRGKDVTFKVNSKLTTNLITLGHAAFQALEKPDKDVDLELCKRLWIRSVKALIGLRLAGGGAIPAIKGVDVAAFYGINGATPSKTEAEIKRLEAKLAKLKAKAGKK
jgi:hypothetical protein